MLREHNQNEKPDNNSDLIDQNACTNQSEERADIYSLRLPSEDASTEALLGDNTSNSVTPSNDHSSNQHSNIPTEASRLIGEIVKGRSGSYKILEYISSGGMSDVYKARIEITANEDSLSSITAKFVGRITACKVLLSRLLDDKQHYQRFQQEATIAKRLSHPNIVNVYDAGEINGRPFIILEYVDGSTLSDICTADKTDKTERLPIHRALPIFLQISRAFAYAHLNNVIHRDLKPSNIVLTKTAGSDDFVKVVDFGIAKIISETTDGATQLTKTGNVFGTPLYMSPEQCVGKTVDTRSDIYSFGILMYKVLTGYAPFEGSEVLALQYKQINEMPKTIENIDSDIRLIRKVESIIFRCIEKEPDSRYQTMEEIARDLETVIGSGATGLKVIAWLNWLLLRFIRGAKSTLKPLDTRSWLFVIGALAAFVLMVIMFSSVSIPDDEVQILNKEIDLRFLVYKMTKPAEIDKSTALQLAILGDTKICRQFIAARNFKNQGDLNAAIIGHRDALLTADSLNLGDKEVGAEIMSELALCYLFVGDLPEAKQFSDKALSTLQQLGYYYDIKALLASLVKAQVLVMLKEDDAARKEFEHMKRTLVGADIKQRFDQVAYSESFWADFLRKHGEFVPAESYYKSAEEHWSGFQADGAFNKGAILDQMALLQLANKQFSLAKESLNKALSSLESSSEQTNLANSKLAFHLSQIYWEQHNFVAALFSRAEAKELLKSKH